MCACVVQWLGPVWGVGDGYRCGVLGLVSGVQAAGLGLWESRRGQEKASAAMLNGSYYGTDLTA